MMASHTSSMQVNDKPDGEVNLPEAEYVCSGCSHTWDNECSQCTSHMYKSSLRLGKSCHPVSESWVGPWRLALAVCRSMTTQMERSTCPKQSMYAVDVIALGTMRARCVTTGLPCWYEALALRVRTRTRGGGQLHEVGQLHNEKDG